MPTVFISYRKSDTGGQAGRLTDSLGQKAGSDIVFRDATDIVPGDLFDRTLRAHLAECSVVLVLIGPQWLDELDARRKRSAVDYVRVEIATAIALRKRVIPVLTSGAALPSADALPDDIRALVHHQALRLHDESWSADVDRLLDAIGRPYAWKKVIVRAVLCVVAIVVAVKALISFVPFEFGDDLAAVRRLVLTLIALYALIETGIYARHWLRLRRS